MDESRIDPEVIPDDIELSRGENVSGVAKVRRHDTHSYQSQNYQ